MIDEGVIDILFVNEGELATLTGLTDFEAGVAEIAPKVPVLVATRSEKGAIAIAHGVRAEVAADRKSVVEGQRGSVRVDPGGRLIIKKKINQNRRKMKTI